MPPAPLVSRRFARLWWRLRRRWIVASVLDRLLLGMVHMPSRMRPLPERSRRRHRRATAPSLSPREDLHPLSRGMTLWTLGCWLGAPVVLHVSSSTRSVTLLRVLRMLWAMLASVRSNLLLRATLPLQALEDLVPEAPADLSPDTGREVLLADALALEHRTTVTTTRRWLTVAAASITAPSATTRRRSAIPANELTSVRIVHAVTGGEDQGVVELG